MRQVGHDSHTVGIRRHGYRRELGRLVLGVVAAVGILCSVVPMATANNALVLDGTDDYVIIAGDPAALKLTGPMTVEAWFKHPAVSVAVPAVIASKAGPGGPSWVMDLNSTEGTLEFIAFGGDGVTPSIAASMQNLNDGAWHHAAGVWDGADARLYIDGTLDSVGGASTAPLADTTDAVVLGADASLDSAVLFTGEIDEVRIWDTARSDAEVAATMNTTLVGNETNLVGYWNFDGGTADDLAGASHGTIGGGALISASDAPVSGGSSEGVLAFDGIDDHAVMPDSAFYNFGSATPFAVSFWMKPDATQQDVTLPVNTVLGKGTYTSGAFPFLFRYVNSTDPTYPGSIDMVRFDGTSSPEVISTKLVNDGAWHHVAGVSDGSNLTLYVDGVSQGAASESGLGGTGNPSGLYVGIDSDALYPFSGSVDEIRIWDGWLTDAEVAADMTTLTPAAPSNGGSLVGQWSFDDGGATDASGNANDGALVNGAATVDTPVANVSVASLDFGSVASTTTSAAQSFTITNPGASALTITDVVSTDGTRYAVTGRATPYTLSSGDPAESYDVTFTPDASGTFDAQLTVDHDGRGPGSVSVTGVGSAGAAANSVLLDGVDDYVIIDGDPAALKLTGAMTVEAWFKHPAVAVAPPAVIASKAGPGGPSWVMDLSSTDGNIEFLAFGGNGASPSGAASAQNLNDGVWHHAAGVWDGIEPRLYIDGVLAAVGPTSTGPLFDTTDAVVIGNDAALDPTPLFTGEIDEVRIWDIARSDAEIAATMNTTLVGDETNLVGYWNFDSGTADDLAGASHGTLGGGASLVTSEAPLSGGAESEQALTLDGVDDFVEVGNTASLQITGAITVESWFRTSRDYSALTPFNVLAGKWFAGGTRAAYALAISDSTHLAGAEGLSFIIYNDSFNHLAAASNLDYNDGQWHHAAGTWDGSTISLYVDGALVASNTDGAFGAISDISDQFRIGTDAWSDSTRWFEGALDDVRVWNVARTQAEVQAGITGWVDPTSAGLQGFWTFNSGDGADSTTSANDGTLTNGAAVFATPIMDTSVTEIPFGSQDVGVESASQSFTITNSGDSVVNVSAVASGDPTRFSVTGPATPFAVAVGATSGQFDVTFTPDTAAAFASSIALTHDARGLTSVAVTGTGESVITAPTGDLDDTKIVFAQAVNGSTQDIFVRDADGTLTNLTNNPTVHETAPVWSPDGTQIAFSGEASGNHDIWRADFDATTNTAANFVQLTTHTAHDWSPAWSPLGGEIAFHSARTGLEDVFKVTTDGVTETQLTFNAAGDNRAVWSPDGTQIAYSSARGVNGEDDLFIISASGDDSAPTQVTATGDDEIYPDWSPDGLKLAFQGRTPPSGPWDLYVIGVDGTGLTPLTVANDPTFSENRPAWSPDGTRIVYDSNPDGDSEIYAVNADNTGIVEQFTANTVTDSVPDWSPFFPPAPVADQALTFDGSTSYVDMGDAAALKITGSLTVETWFRTTQAVGNYVTLMGKWHTGSSDASYGLSWTTAGGLGFVINDATNAVITAGSGQPYNDALWHHAAGVWDGAQALLYVDGDLVGSATGSGAAIADTTLSFILGSDATLDSSRFFQGDMDETRVWNVARTRDEIRAAMNIPPVNTDVGLVGHWDFDDGTAADLSFSGIGGTLNAATATPIASAQFDVTDLAFGVNDVGVPSSALTFTVTNTGAEAMLVNGSTSSDAAFAVTAPGTPWPLNAGVVSSAASIAFTADRAGGAFGSVFVDHDARGPRFVTLSGIGSITPPTGDLTAETYIAYQTNAGGIYGIDKARPDGSGATVAISSASDEESPGWSPDATQLVFTRGGHIWIADDGGASETQLTTAGTNDRPSVSPDGLRVLFESDRDANAEIYVLELADPANTQANLSNSPTATDGNPTWSPDGGKIAYASSRTGLGANPEGDLEIVVADFDDATSTISNVLQLTANAASDNMPAWAPGGARIAFRTDLSGVGNDIYIMDADGANQAAVTTDAAAETSPAWSPDGTQIAFERSGDIWTAAVDGSGESLVVSDTGTQTMPAWSPFVAPPVLAEQAALFDGVDDYIDFGDVTALKITSALTVEAWFNTTHDLTDSPTLASKWLTGGTDASYGLGWSAGTGLRFAVNDSSNNVISASSGLSLNDGVWHHVAGVWDGAEAAIYVDGELAGSAPGFAFPVADTTLAFIVGTDETFTSQRSFGGLIDEARVWNIARTADEIKAAMTTSPDPATTGLAGYWDFNDAAATDLTVNENDGPLTGAITQLIPVANVDLQAVALGVADVGATVGPQSFTITNVGDADLNLTGVATPDQTHFAVTTTGLPAVVAPGATSAAIDVTFTADRAGGEFSWVDIAHDGRGFMRVDISGVGRLTNVPTGDLADTRIAFARGSGSGRDIYLVDPDGGNAVAIVTDAAGDWNPTWSPDGTQIAFQTDRDGDREIYVMNADGTSQVNITNDGYRDQTPDWSPDGTQIVYMHRGDVEAGATHDIYVMNADGTAQTPLTSGPTDDSRPIWSPDGQKITFFSSFDGLPDVYTINADGTGLTRLTDGATYTDYPRWSPDGSQIAYSGEGEGVSEGGSPLDIWVMNADGSSHTNLTQTADADEFEPYWSPDGSQIVYKVYSEVGANLAIIDVETLDVTALPNTADDKNPAWSPFFESLPVAERAAAFDGIDSEAVLPDDAAYNFGAADDFTVSLWLKVEAVQPDTSAAENVILEKNDGSGAYPFALRYLNATTSDGGRLQFARDDGVSVSDVLSVERVDDGRYHHVAFVRDSGAMRLYIDGRLDEDATDNSVNPTTNASSLFVGGRMAGLQRFAGAVDDLRIYSAPLTADDVRADAASTTPVTPAGGGAAVAHWNFDDGTATDLVGVATGSVTGVTFPAIPVASTDVAGIAFGVVDVGSSGTPAGFTVTNTGSETLTITGISSGDAQFVVTAPALPLTLLQGETSGSLSVDFSPDYVGDERVSVVISHDGKGGSFVLAHGIGRVEPPIVDLANTRIAFSSDRRLGDGTRDIYAMTADGSRVLPMRFGSDWNPVWSPDGARVAFQTDIDGDREIYVMNADGSDARNLTNNAASDQTPDWSPDGSSIAFVSDRDGNQEIYVMSPDGAGQTRLTETPDGDRRPRWSPDGSKLAYVSWSADESDSEVFVIRADGTDRLQITDHPSFENHAAWSPDGISIAFLTYRDENADIYTTTADGATATRLTNTPEDEIDSLDWAPDGSRLVFTSFGAAGESSPSAQEIFTLSVDGTDRQRLTTNAALDSNSRWSGVLPETVAWLTLADGPEMRGAALGFDSVAADTVILANAEDVEANSLVISEPVELTARRDGARLLRDVVTTPAADAAVTWHLTARVTGGVESIATIGWRQEEIDAMLAAAGEYNMAMLTETASERVWALSPTNNPIALNTRASGVYKFELTIEKTATQPVTIDLDAGWNLVSIPGRGDLTPLQSVNASAFAWDAADGGRYTTLGQISQTSVSHVDTGFWLLATAAGPQTLELDLDSQVARSVSTTLKAGWNLIGAPADLPAPLPAAAVDGGYPHNVLGYGDGQYSVASELSQGKGYWVLNSSGADRDVTLTQMRHLSDDGKDSLFRAAPKLPDTDWELRLSLDMANGVTHGVTLGSSKYAREGYDALDIPQPPSPAARGFTAFYAEAEGVANRLTRSMVPVAKDDVEWTLAAKMGASGTLSWDGIELPQGYRMFLRNGDATRALDRDGRLRLRKGDHSLNAYLTWTPPTATRTLPNYPNPFNPETWIPFELSEASEVAIRVYDSRGMLVRRIDVGYREEGYYTRRADAAHWDGRNEFGESVASGMYVYEVRAGSYRGLRRMVILK